MPAYLRIDKIIGIKTNPNQPQTNDYLPAFYEVKYELSKIAAEKFIPLENEIIIDKTEDKIIVCAHVINAFNFFQRMLNFGTECKILEPDFMIKDYLKYLQDAIEVYYE